MVCVVCASCGLGMSTDCSSGYTVHTCTVKAAVDKDDLPYICTFILVYTVNEVVLFFECSLFVCLCLQNHK